jgi:hypothetical protein
MDVDVFSDCGFYPPFEFFKRHSLLIGRNVCDSLYGKCRAVLDQVRFDVILLYRCFGFAQPGFDRSNGSSEKGSSGDKYIVTCRADYRSSFQCGTNPGGA